ncbi:hypothetical protein GRS48_12560 [Halorubrum sp. JWXQ-INN 858]|uniref:hypothetical protein n=1 Tax=Halorubrum sp. JWXQ-INN 858 TaxID=2690782 RepID=UPI00135CCEEB|nr:hypothetical protein [Halorubrum sp. JWXQ-INN 858]MWV65644.1 hypothetical protein [Halorubrum sp. JWXQ-INN 858]
MSVEEQLTDTQREVVEVLREGRATPQHIEQNTTIPSKHAVQHHLKELRLADVVIKVNTGLYELSDEFDN